ncbi:MAG TPA: hypothetical protein VLW85_04225 [Myxococcales bacterium]|nr:hypothetical protein [Myxococcales bacterium]
MTRAAVALAAAQGAQAILAGLPASEARLRAERELGALSPLAVDAPQLAAVAVLQLALQRPGDALDSARRAAGRDPHCAPAVWLAAKLEREPGLTAAAAQALKQHALWLLDAHGPLARAGDPAAQAELCAAREEAPAELAIQRLLEEAKNGCVPPAAEDRRAAARALAAARTPLVRAALARAAARDPDPDIRAAAQGALASAVR